MPAAHRFWRSHLKCHIIDFGADFSVRTALTNVVSVVCWYSQWAQRWCLDMLCVHRRTSHRYFPPSMLTETISRTVIVHSKWMNPNIYATMSVRLARDVSPNWYAITKASYLRKTLFCVNQFDWIWLTVLFLNRMIPTKGKQTYLYACIISIAPNTKNKTYENNGSNSNYE